MNAVAITYLEVILAVVLVCAVFALAIRKELLASVRETTAWLLKVSFLDLVQMVIFIKPWKKYVKPTGVGLWLVLVYIVGRYTIVSHPKISEISGPYIPMIGYVYFVSLLFILSFVLCAATKAADHD